jgi:hypothetical protein
MVAMSMHYHNLLYDSNILCTDIFSKDNAALLTVTLENEAEYVYHVKPVI